MNKIVLYHGSDHIIERPKYGVGNIHNDYGQAFYCTVSLELAKEWTNKSTTSGFANKYMFDGRGLKVLNLTDKSYSVLNWIAVLMHHRMCINEREWISYISDTVQSEMVNNAKTTVGGDFAI